MQLGCWFEYPIKKGMFVCIFGTKHEMENCPIKGNAGWWVQNPGIFGYVPNLEIPGFHLGTLHPRFYQQQLPLFRYELMGTQENDVAD